MKLLKTLKTQEEGHEYQQQEWNRTRMRLRTEAEGMKENLLAEQEERLLKFQTAHQADSQSYEFRCERWGDFLAVFIKRGSTAERKSWNSGRSNRVCSSLNIGISRKISLYAGHAPDMNGVAYFRAKNEQLDGSYVYKPVAIQPALSHSNRMLILDEPRQPGGGLIYDGHLDDLLGVSVQDCGRPAEDDRIRFEGPGATIFVPAGRGEEVYTAILSAIRAGEVDRTEITSDPA